METPFDGARRKRRGIVDLINFVLSDHHLLIERRTLRWLLALYCLFVLYGTFIPFRFSNEPAFLQSQWQRFLTPPFSHGRKTFSLLDIIANFLLFAPFGCLLVGASIGRFANSFSGALLKTGLCGLAFSLAIELGQLFAPGRTASLLDAVINGAGAAVGGVLGFFIVKELRGEFGRGLATLICWRPGWLLFAVLATVPLADAFYPFHLTLDVSTAWANLKRTQWVPFLRGTERDWLRLFLEKVVVYAALATLALKNIPRSRCPAAASIGLAFCALIALFSQAGKLFFVGRVPNIETLLLAIVGSLLGILVIEPMSRTDFCRRHGSTILLALALALIVFTELTPFDWLAAKELAQRWQRIEWLPLGAYYGADAPSALFDLGKKVFSVGLFGLLLAARRQAKEGRPGRARALGWGLLMGLVLEACQLGLRSRVPSITDVLLFGVGSWFGAALFLYRIELQKSLGAASNGQSNLTGRAIPR